jgi:hypothetical protein
VNFAQLLPAAISRSWRFRIFPVLFLGSAETTVMVWGFLKEARWFRTCWMSAWGSMTASPRATTKAVTDSPHSGSAVPMTAASAIPG